MVVSRCYAHAAVAASAAVETILADEFWQPETGRARALAGARDAADAFQKVSRSLRLTLRLELETAEAVRDLRAGIVTRRDGKSPAFADPFGLAALFAAPPASPMTSATKPAPERADADSEGPFARDERRGGEREGAEFDRPDRVYPRGLVTNLDGRRAEVGAACDWSKVAPARAKPVHRPFEPKPVGWETKPTPEYAARKAKYLGGGPAAPLPDT